MNRENSGASKALRWLTNNFPYNPEPEDDADKMSNTIHLYCLAGAERIEELERVITEQQIIIDHALKEQQMSIDEISKSLDDINHYLRGGMKNE